MSYEIEFAKITNSGKLPDRFLTCQRHSSPDLAKKSMGEILTLVEMLSPWFPTAQVGQTIVNNFVKYYYQGGSTSDLVNFEASLKRVNEDLAQITQNGETDWIGNLNALLAVIVGNNLHLASTGQVEAYIFRDGKVNHLTENQPAPAEPHPLKTFSNIISGELKSRDKIVVANKGLFNHLSLDTVRQIISLNNPSAAGLQISKLLRRGRIKTINVIIVEVGSKEELSSETIKGPQEEVFYLDKSTDSLTSKLTDSIKNLGKSLKNAAAKLRGTKAQKPTAGAPINEPEKDQFHQEFMSEEATRDDGLLKDEEIKYSPDLYVHYYNAENARKEIQDQKSSSRINRVLLKTISWLWLRVLSLFDWVTTSARDPSRRKNLYIALCILLIIVVSLFVLIRSRGNKVGNLSSQKILDEALAAQKEGKNLTSNGSQEQAKDQFASCIEKAQSILDKALVAKDAQNALLGCYSELDKLTATTRFNDLKPLNTFPENAKSLFILSGQSFVVTDSDIYQGSLVGGAPSKVASIPQTKGNFIAGAQSDTIIYLYTSGQNLYQYDTSTKKIELAKITEGNRWETANSLTSYAGSLYLLDGIVGQIYKHSSNNTEFQKGEEYISTANINLRDSVSMTIDGSVYILKNTGKAVKLQKSRLITDFSLRNIPTPYDTITKPIKIYTDSDTPSLYILDAGQNRIVEFDKDGQFIHQYAFGSNFNNITDFDVSIKSRKIWILEKNSIYEISI